MTALIGPSGCGKSTFLRILNRMHEVVPGAQLAGSVKLDGLDIYVAGQRAMDTRRHIGMVFQKPNPFPAMTIADNVLSGLKFSRSRGRQPRRSGRGDAHARPGCGTRSRTGSASSVGRSPAASSSGSASPGPWPSGRGSC